MIHKNFFEQLHIFVQKLDGKINLNEALITSNYNLTEVNNPNNNGRYKEYLKL